MKEQILEDFGYESDSTVVTCVIKGTAEVILAEMWLGKFRSKCMQY